MRTVDEINELLNELERQPASALEAQDLDFKEWSPRSVSDAIAMVVEMAVCMANGGGGTVVFGVNDKAVGRSLAILGIPPEIDVNRLKRTIYDTTDPKLMPVFEDLPVPEGTQRLLIMQVHPGLPPHTDTAGRGKIRVGTDCQPLTGTLRRRIMVETGETDFTAGLCEGHIDALISPTAIEQIRSSAARERAPTDLLNLSDYDLLNDLGLLKQGRFTRGGLLLAGKAEAIAREIPNYAWTYLRMRTDTDYEDRLDGRDAIPQALSRITDRVMAYNPIATIAYGLFHFEYRTYPEIALREAMLNAFCHADYRLGGPVLIKHFHDCLEISNPGGFIGGVTPDNILHHPPVSRNPLLVDAMSRLRLVNRSNLGIQRMFSALLVEGKEPPIIEELGDTVRVTFTARNISAPFRAFVEEENKRGVLFGVDTLMIFQYLLLHGELLTQSAAALIQRSEAQTRDILSRMEREHHYLERGVSGRGTYWTLRPEIHRRVATSGHAERDRRIDWESAKTRVLSVLRQRGERGEQGLSNSELRQLTHYDRSQVKRLMAELQTEGVVRPTGKGRGARWEWSGRNGPGK
jgi:ATP-dependent DNA helicase RecG